VGESPEAAAEAGRAGVQRRARGNRRGGSAGDGAAPGRQALAGSGVVVAGDERVRVPRLGRRGEEARTHDTAGLGCAEVLGVDVLEIVRVRMGLESSAYQGGRRPRLHRLFALGVGAIHRHLRSHIPDDRVQPRMHILDVVFVENLLLDDGRVLLFLLALCEKEVQQRRETSLQEYALEHRHARPLIHGIQREIEHVEEDMQRAEISQGIEAGGPGVPDVQLPHIASAIRVRPRLGRLRSHHIREHAQGRGCSRRRLDADSLSRRCTGALLDVRFEESVVARSREDVGGVPHGERQARPEEELDLKGERLADRAAENPPRAAWVGRTR